MQISRQTVRKSAAHSKEGVVVTARRQSAQAASAMLEAGGNAVDAAVAAAFVAGVIEPMETTLYGSGFMLVSVPGGDPVYSVDFGPRAPLLATSNMFRIDRETKTKGAPGISLSSVENNANVEGILAIGVPANFRGMIAALKRFGTLPLEKVMKPAIAAAHEGFIRDSYYTLEALSNLRALRANPCARNLYLDDGLPPLSADLGSATLGVATYLKQPELGRTLEIIADKGAQAFYQGELGAHLLDTVKSLGGILSQADLDNSRPTIAPARKIVFRDTEVWAPNGPCGAATMLQMLQIWQALFPDGSPTEDSPERLRLLAHTIWHAFADRYHWLGDPDFVRTPDQAIISVPYAREIARIIRSGIPAPISPQDYDGPWSYFAKYAEHDPWAHQKTDPAEIPKWEPGGATAPTAGTTHISVIDAKGMAVSLTHTAANIFGSKVVCPHTGLLFDAAMGWFNAQPGAANSIAGGKRPLANMGPLLITKDRQALAAIGAPGGRRILSAVTQVAINLIDRSMNVEAAVAAPRCDASGSDLLVSERLADKVMSTSEMQQRSKIVQEQHEGFLYELARPLMATRDTQGNLSACGDPFTRNCALGL